MVVKIERDAAKVLTSNGTPEQPDVRVCRLPDIQRRVIFKQKPMTQDKDNNTVRGRGR